MFFALRNLRTRPQPIVPAARSRRSPRRSHDPWQGIACDLIERFSDVQCVKWGLGRRSRHAYREDLLRLDDWMMQKFGRTLMTAHAEDLHRYFNECIQSDASTRSVIRALSSMQSFYRFLRDAGCRSDDPVEQMLGSLRARGRTFLSSVAAA